WRWIFFINVPIGLLGIALAGRFLREQRASLVPGWDGWGLASAAVGFGSLLYAASIVAQRGWRAPEVIGSLALGACALSAPAFVELRHARDPLLALRLFCLRSLPISTPLRYGPA